MLIPEILKPQFNIVASNIYEDVALKVNMVKLSLACVSLAVNHERQIFGDKPATADTFITDSIHRSLDMLDSVNKIYPYTRYFDASDNRVETAHKFDELTETVNHQIHTTLQNLPLLNDDVPSAQNFFQVRAFEGTPKETLSTYHSYLMQMAECSLRTHIEQRASIDRLIILELGHEAITNYPVANMDPLENILPIAIDFRGECIVQQNKTQKLVSCLKANSPC